MRKKQGIERAEIVVRETTLIVVKIIRHLRKIIRLLVKTIRHLVKTIRQLILGIKALLIIKRLRGQKNTLMLSPMYGATLSRRASRTPWRNPQFMANTNDWQVGTHGVLVQVNACLEINLIKH